MNDAPLTRTFVILASVVILIAGLKIAQPIIVPVFIALFLTILTSPAVTYLVKFRIPVSFAVTLVVIALLGFFYALASLVATNTDEFIARLPSYQSQLQDALIKLQTNAPWLVEELKQSITNFQPTESAISLLKVLFSGLGSVLTAIVLTTFTLIFTLFEAQSASAKITRAFGDDHSIQYVKKFSRLVQRYLLIKSLISAATGIIVAVMLWLMGVDYPILWGTFAFLMNFIPNVGSILAAFPPMLLASIQMGIPGFLMTLGGFTGINMIIGNFIEPRLMGKTLDISTLVVFLSLIFWGWILGPMGMLLAIPLTVVIKIGLEVYPKTKWLAQLISQ